MHTQTSLRMEASNLMYKESGSGKWELKSSEKYPGSEPWSHISLVRAQTTVLQDKGSIKVVGILPQLF